MKILLLIISLFLFLIKINAQNEEVLRNNPDKYYLGVANYDDEQKARNLAKINLCENIKSYVSSTSFIQITNNSGKSDNIMDFNAQVSSNFILKNVQYVSKKIGKTYRTIAYITKEDYNSVIKDISIEVKQYYERALKQFSSKDLSKDLFWGFHSLYLSYLKTFYSPAMIYYLNSEENDTIQDIRPVIKQKIEMILNDIKIEHGKPYINPKSKDQILIQIYATYQNINVEKIYAQPSSTDSPKMLIEDGKANLIIYTMPSFRNNDLMVTLSCWINDKSESDLLTVHNLFNISVEKKIEIDYSPIINFDFSWEKIGTKVYQFNFTKENLSISSIHWNFGDGTTSSEQSPLHTYSDTGNYNVTLKLNDDFVITKSLLQSKNLLIKEVVKSDTNQIATVANSNFITTPLLKEFVNALTWDELSKLLKKYKDSNKLIFGKKETFINPDNCYVFIVNPETKNVIAIISNEPNRTDLLKCEQVKDFDNQFKGNIFVWVQFF